jgi:hypothetical protein
MSLKSTWKAFRFDGGTVWIHPECCAPSDHFMVIKPPSFHMPNIEQDNLVKSILDHLNNQIADKAIEQPKETQSSDWLTCAAKSCASIAGYGGHTVKEFEIIFEKMLTDALASNPIEPEPLNIIIRGDGTWDISDAQQ